MARGRKISAESKVKAQCRRVPEVTILLLFLLHGPIVEEADIDFEMAFCER